MASLIFSLGQLYFIFVQVTLIIKKKRMYKYIFCIGFFFFFSLTKWKTLGKTLMGCHRLQLKYNIAIVARSTSERVVPRRTYVSFGLVAPSSLLQSSRPISTLQFYTQYTESYITRVYGKYRHAHKHKLKYYYTCTCNGTGEKLRYWKIRSLSVCYP